MSITVSKVEGQSEDGWEFVKSAFVSSKWCGQNKLNNVNFL